MTLEPPRVNAGKCLKFSVTIKSAAASAHVKQNLVVRIVANLPLQGGRFVVAPELVLEHRLASGPLQRRHLQRRILVLGGDSSLWWMKPIGRCLTLGG